VPIRWFMPVIFAGLALAAASPAAAQTGECSRDTATALARQVDPFLLDDPVVQFICGPFTGPGSQAMAIETGPAPTCWAIQHWGVFTFENGAWRKVLQRWEYVIGDLVAVGGDLRVTTAMHRDTTEPRCVFEGGSQVRTWHWDGARFVANKPEQVTPPEPRTHAFFNSPAGLGVQCGMSDQPGPNGVGITCQSVRIRPKLYQQQVTMSANGRVSICRDRGLRNRCNLGNSGEEPVPTYKYGTDVTVGRFRCRVHKSGVRCTVVATGKGFVISRNRAARL
jgi:hypothetical protein